MKEIVHNCSVLAGCREETADAVICTFLDLIVQELSKGNPVDLGDDFGIFTVKLRSGMPQPGSPRTPKDSRYKVIFRENKGMRQRLKVQEMQK